MKTAILGMILIFIAGCAAVQQETMTSTEELLLDGQDIEQMEMKKDLDNPDLEQLGITLDENACKTEEYETHERAPLAQYSICSYTIPNLNDTEIIIELKRFTNFEDLNGSYQYNSLHLRSSEGLISEDRFGDQSRFSVNTEFDYGGEFNNESISYYHLWITKDRYLIHITSDGSKKAKDIIEDIAQSILSKFE